jgi:UDP-N-acetylmuramoyl-tripeptide--D-alanyl-D-alanine ligase
MGIDFSGNREPYIFIPSPGKHMVTNALLAAAAGGEFGLTFSQIANGIAAFVTPDGRMAIHSARDIKILDDTYNANPASMKAAIDVLAGMEALRRVCVLGDMFELGAHTERLHRETGEYAVGSGIDLIIAVGKNARYYTSEDANWFKDNEDFLTQWDNILKPGDAVLFKASNGMKFDEIIKRIID